MTITIEAKSLVAALKLASKAIMKNKTLPITQCARLHVDDGCLCVTATDFDMAAKTIIPLVSGADQSFDVAANVKDMLKLISGTGLVTLSVNGDKLAIESAFGNDTINARVWSDMGDQTILRLIEETHDLAQCNGLVSAMNDVAFAMSNEPARYYLNGIYCHAHNGKLRLVATNGHRLAVRDTDVLWPDRGEIIPRLTINLALHAFKKADTLAFGYVGKHHCMLRHGNTTIVSRFIDGSFPNYTRVMPDEANAEHMFVANAEQLGKACVDIARIAKSAARFVADNGLLTISSSNDDGARIVRTMPCMERAQEIGFNPRYIKDICDLAQDHKELVTFRYADNGSPALVNISGKHDLQIAQMPMRL